MTTANRIKKAKDFGALCALFGYTHEDHVAQTQDGYLLGLHRLRSKRGQDPRDDEPQKPVVYIHHGLLTSSELFLCLTDAERCLPLVLVEQGYDVWLGNNRGNKYSQKHVDHPSNSSQFWDFSIDHFARYDIPDTIQYILDATHAPTLSYIGFSQGTAQAFAALSIHPWLNERINVFVALAPIISPPGFATHLLDTVVKHSPSFIFRVFGRKSMLSSVAYWQTYCPHFILRRIIDTSLVYLFKYYSHNISPAQKVAGYAHIYCYSSVKAVVHWFQIMRNASFHMYDNMSSDSDLGQGSKILQKFPTQGIKTPMVLLYGNQDSLLDIETTLRYLPASTTGKLLDGYEHLDVLWGDNVHKDVIPEVLESLKRYNGV